jgi:hypothetical protein
VTVKMKKKQKLQKGFESLVIEVRYHKIKSNKSLLNRIKNIKKTKVNQNQIYRNRNLILLKLYKKKKRKRKKIIPMDIIVNKWHNLKKI